MKSSEFVKQSESKLTEGQINKRCVDYVRGRGFTAVRTHAGRVKVKGGWMHNNEKSCPDYMISVHGQVVWFEGKKTDEKATAAQKEQHEKLISQGDFVICTDEYQLFVKTFDEIADLCRHYRAMRKLM